MLRPRPVAMEMRFLHQSAQRMLLLFQEVYFRSAYLGYGILLCGSGTFKSGTARCHVRALDICPISSSFASCFDILCSMAVTYMSVSTKQQLEEYVESHGIRHGMMLIP